MPGDDSCTPGGGQADRCSPVFRPERRQRTCELEAGRPAVWRDPCEELSRAIPRRPVRGPAGPLTAAGCSESPAGCSGRDRSTPGRLQEIDLRYGDALFYDSGERGGVRLAAGPERGRGLSAPPKGDGRGRVDRTACSLPCRSFRGMPQSPRVVLLFCPVANRRRAHHESRGEWTRAGAEQRSSRKVRVTSARRPPSRGWGTDRRPPPRVGGVVSAAVGSTTSENRPRVAIRTYVGQGARDGQASVRSSSSRPA